MDYKKFDRLNDRSIFYSSMNCDDLSKQKIKFFIEKRIVMFILLHDHRHYNTTTKLKLFRILNKKHHKKFFLQIII